MIGKILCEAAILIAVFIFISNMHPKYYNLWKNVFCMIAIFCLIIGFVFLITGVIFVSNLFLSIAIHAVVAYLFIFLCSVDVLDEWVYFLIGISKLVSTILFLNSDFSHSELNTCRIISIIINAILVLTMFVMVILDKKNKQRTSELLDAVNRGDKQIAQELIAKGARVNSDVMEIAVKNSNKEIVSLLIENGADIHYCGPLVTAVESGDKDMVSLLIQKGADVNTAYGKPLITAIQKGEKEIVSLLIEKGANVNLDYEGKLPLDFTKNGEIIALLKTHDARTKQEQNILDIDFISAVRNQDIEKVKALIPQVSNIDIIIPGHELVDIIPISKFGNWIENSIPMHREVLTEDVKEKLTPLMYAVRRHSLWNSDMEMIKVLAENGANVNASDSHGRTALLYAVFKEEPNIELIDFLISKRANVNAKWSDEVNINATALMQATIIGDIRVVEMLINHGADVNAKTSNGVTALGLAKYKKHTEIAALLKKNGAWD